MSSTGLYFNLCRGFRRWQGMRQQRSQFLKWLKTGKVDLTLKAISNSFNQGVLVGFLQSALLEGADEIVFVSRELRGIRPMESQPSFWNFCDVSARDKWLAASPAPLTSDDMEYMVRYQGFQRIDKYHSLPRLGLLLRGGFGPWMDDSLEVFRETLGRTRSLSIISDEDSRLRSSEASLKLLPHRPGMLCGCAITYGP